MVTEIKRERLEMMKDIYENKCSVDYLKKKFGEVKYEELIEFLQGDAKYIKPKEVGVESESNDDFLYIGLPPIKWKLTIDGVKYYEEELEKTNMNNNPTISAVNSNVNFHSPHSPQSNQFLEINKNELTPEVLEILQELQKAIKDEDEGEKEKGLKKLKNVSEKLFWIVVAKGIDIITTAQNVS